MADKKAGNKKPRKPADPSKFSYPPDGKGMTFYWDADGNPVPEGTSTLGKPKKKAPKKK